MIEPHCRVGGVRGQGSEVRGQGSEARGQGSEGSEERGVRGQEGEGSGSRDLNSLCVEAACKVYDPVTLLSL